MLKQALLLLFLVSGIAAYAQNDLMKIVREGIVLHDKGDYEGAIRKYDEVLAQDADHFDANYEKAYSLNMLKKYDQCIDICKKLEKKYTGDPMMNNVYVTWGNALDHSGKPKDALKVYQKGIERFPSFHLLHYNKAITLAGLNENEECALATKAAISSNHLHGSSHFLLSRLMRDNKIPSLLSSLAFLAIEPTTTRAKENLKNVEDIIKGNVEEVDGKINITINADALDDTSSRDDNFGFMEMMLGFLSALDHQDSLKDAGPTALLQLKLDMIINILSEQKKEDSKGYYWEHYVPFMRAMQQEGLLEVFSHIAYASRDLEENAQWLSDNGEMITEFYTWLKAYKW